MDIKALAQAAGFDVHPRKGDIRSPHDFAAVNITGIVEKFARMVADAEREECAKVCEELLRKRGTAVDLLDGADAIRMRSNVTELSTTPKGRQPGAKRAVCALTSS